jgi:hypothetical protein
MAADMTSLQQLAASLTPAQLQILNANGFMSAMMAKHAQESPDNALSASYFHTSDTAEDCDRQLRCANEQDEVLQQPFPDQHTEMKQQVNSPVARQPPTSVGAAIRPLNSWIAYRSE